MDPTAVDLLQFVPQAPNDGNLITTVPTQPTRGDQFTVKVDHRINDKQNLSIYYYFNDERTVQPFANFRTDWSRCPRLWQHYRAALSSSGIFPTPGRSATALVNESRFNYNREAQQTFQHPENTELVQNSCPPAPSLAYQRHRPSALFLWRCSQATNSVSIRFSAPNREGLPSISVAGGFDLGNDSEGELPQTGNSFQWADNLTKVSGNHTFKFGVDVRRQQFNQFLYYNVSGTFDYYGGGPNDVRCRQPVPQFSVGPSRSIRTRLGAGRICPQHWPLSCSRRIAGRLNQISR